jgi:ABC-type amino acid transport system permease subunit
MRFAELWAVGRLHWRYFLLAWSYPVFLYLSLIALSLSGPISNDNMPWLFLGALCLFVVSIVLGSVPYRRRKITGGQAFFWILIVPSVVLLLFSQMPFSFPITITDIPAHP